MPKLMKVEAESSILQNKAYCIEPGCGWKGDGYAEYREAAGSAQNHVRDTGHTVKRIYESETTYREKLEEEGVSPEESTKKRKAHRKKHEAWCNACNKEIAPTGVGIVVYWAASSHTKKTGHKVVVRKLDEPRIIPAS